jgi:hypothetical protein
MKLQFGYRSLQTEKHETRHVDGGDQPDLAESDPVDKLLEAASLRIHLA